MMALVVVAVTIAAATILAAIDGGPGRGGHVHLWPLSHPYLGVVLAATLIAVAVRRRRAQVAAVLVAVVALGAGGLAHVFSDPPSGPSVVASSAGLQVVSYRVPGLFLSDSVVLRLRTREGLASREGAADIACFIVPSSGAGPEWLFAHADFTGPDEVVVQAQDGSTWWIRVDPRRLSAAQPVDRCTGAPDLLGD